MRNHLALLIVAAALASCSSAPTPNPNLDAAATLYNQASNDPAVVRDAPLELQQSRDALTRAQSLWQKKEDAGEVDHYAYLAARHAETAQQMAKLKESESQIAASDATRTQLAMTAAEAAEARRQAEDLQQQLATLQSRQSNAGMVLTLGNILFDTNGTALKPGAYDSIRQIAAYLRQHPERTVTVEGFTDSTGSPEHNRELSQLRAEAVRNALLKEGVAPDRVVARGMGESEPVANNATAAGRQLNRRVQVAISDSTGHVPGGVPAASGTTAVPASR